MQEWGASDPDLHTLFQDAFYKDYIHSPRGVAKINALVRRGKDLNKPSVNGQYPLHLSIKNKIDGVMKLRLVKQLVHLGANIHQKNKQGLTSFQIAISNGDNEIALFLLSEGARHDMPTGSRA